MTMRFEKQYRIGQPGVVYEYDVKLSMRLRVVEITDEELAEEARFAVEVFGEELRNQYPWVGTVYQTGRSGGWLAVTDRTGGATQSALEAIGEQVDEARVAFEDAIIEGFGYSPNGAQQSFTGPGFMDPKLKSAYEFFRAQGGGIVGESGKGALNLARAEAYARDNDWVFEWEEDPEPYDLGDEEEPPLDVLVCYLKDADDNILASLGSIGTTGDSRLDRDRRREIEAELALEAMPADSLVKNGTSEDAAEFNRRRNMVGTTVRHMSTGRTFDVVLSNRGSEIGSRTDLLKRGKVVSSNYWLPPLPDFLKNSSADVATLERMSLARLRRHQSLIQKQIEAAYEQRNTPALTRLQARQREVDQAIMQKEFGR